MNVMALFSIRFTSYKFKSFVQKSPDENMATLHQRKVNLTSRLFLDFEFVSETIRSFPSGNNRSFSVLTQNGGRGSTDTVPINASGNARRFPNSYWKLQVLS
jgi:hypothetical protein